MRLSAGLATRQCCHANARFNCIGPQSNSRYLSNSSRSGRNLDEAHVPVPSYQTEECRPKPEEPGEIPSPIEQLWP